MAVTDEQRAASIQANNLRWQASCCVGADLSYVGNGWDTLSREERLRRESGAERLFNEAARIEHEVAT